MRLLNRPERRTPMLALGRRPPRQVSCRLPGRIRFHRAATGDELTQHRVIDAHAGEKPCPDLAALPRIRPQRPGPHMGGCALRALTRTRLTHRLPNRCRRHAVGLTHSTTVEVTTDNTDLSPCAAQRVAAARAPGVRTNYRRPVFTDAMLTFTETTMRTACDQLDVEVVRSTAKPTTCTCSPPTRPPGDLRPGPAPQRPHRSHGPARVHRRVCPCQHARPPLVAVLIRRLLWCTAVDHQAIHRRPRPTTLNAGLRPPTHRMGSPRTEVRGLRPRIRSSGRRRRVGRR